MATDTSIESIIPPEWHDHVEPFNKKGSHKKYHFSPGGKDAIHASKLSLEPTDIISSNDTRFLVMNRGEVSDGFVSVSTDVLGVLGLLQGDLNRTNRFRTSDLGKRSLDARPADMGVLYSPKQINIETLLVKLNEMWLRLSDIGHLLMAAKMPVVHTAIATRLRIAWVHEVVLGASSANEEEFVWFHHPEKGKMSIAQLIYGRPWVVELDVTHPKPNGEGYKPHGSLWVVEKKNLI